MMPILVGTDGSMKMSKSLDNYVAVEEPPNDMYGKLMSLPDSLILPYLELLTDTPEEELAEVGRNLETQAINPINVKKQLAWDITNQFHSRGSADSAQLNFEKVVQSRDLPDDIPEFALTGIASGDGEGELPRWSRFLVDLGLAASTTEAKRLINQSAVEIISPSGGSTILETDSTVGGANPNDVIRVGKRRFVRLVER